MTIPTQEAPPHPGVLLAYDGPLPYRPYQEWAANGADNHQQQGLASLETVDVDAQESYRARRNGNGRVHKSTGSPRRKPTQLRVAKWKAVQKTKCRDLSLLAMARELGIHRDTAKRYAEAKSPLYVHLLALALGHRMYHIGTKSKVMKILGV